MKSKYKIFSIILIIVIFILSVLKISDTNLPEESDKVVHFIMYFFCAAAFYFLKFKYYLFYAIGYGIFIEIVQYFIPWRSFSVGDIIANSLGALSFFIVIKIIFKNKINVY
jgi:VanZ family protein